MAVMSAGRDANHRITLSKCRPRADGFIQNFSLKKKARPELLPAGGFFRFRWGYAFFARFLRPSASFSARPSFWAIFFFDSE